MLYKLSYSVAANTTAIDPDHQKLKIDHGIIKEWIIFFPVEAANMLRIQVRLGSLQVVPANEDQWLYGGGYYFNIGEHLEVFQPPFELDIFAYNLDDTHAHEYNVHANILPEEAVFGRITSPGLLDKIKAWFGAV